MKVPEAIRSIEQVGQEVLTVEGILVAIDGEIYLAPTEEQISDRHSSIEVAHPGVKELLLRTVPAYGGGKYLYADSASIKGVVSACVNSSFPARISLLQNLLVEKHEQWFRVLP